MALSLLHFCRWLNAHRSVKSRFRFLCHGRVMGGSDGSTEGKGPLSGFVIIELCRHSQPFCGMMLADMGAEVIRVERIGAAGDASAERCTNAQSTLNRSGLKVLQGLRHFTAGVKKQTVWSRVFGLALQSVWVSAPRLSGQKSTPCLWTHDRLGPRGPHGSGCRTRH